MKIFLLISFYNARLNRERKIEVKCSNSLHHSVVYLGQMLQTVVFYYYGFKKRNVC